MQKTISLIAISILLVLGCSEKEKTENELVGTWKSLGNAWVLDIAQDSSYVEYDVTDISCLQARASHIDEFGKRLNLKNDTLRLLRGAIEYQFVKSKEIPMPCGQEISREKAMDPIYNFEVFAATIRENYAFFELNTVDWDSWYNKKVEQIRKSPTDLTLYQIMEETLEEINDNHGSFEATKEVYEKLEKLQDSVPSMEVEEELPEIGDFQVAGEVAKHHLIEELTRDSFILQWGKLTESIGYIQVKAMFLLTDLGMSKELIDNLGWDAAWQQTFDKIGEGNYIEEERIGMARTMEKVMQDLGGMDEMVIDIRFNGGGQDLVSLELLRWFNDTPRIIAHETLFHKGMESPVWDIVLPSSEKPFAKPVYLLTSQQTGSAAEVCAMASLTMPHFTRMGMPTMGALSTALEKKLPNGWDFAISNEYYRTPSGNIYEYKGVPVDIMFNYPADRQEFFRSMLKHLDTDKEEILKAIAKKRNQSQSIDQK